MKNENRLIGKIKQAHGLKGEVYVLVFSKDISWMKKLKSINIKSKDKNSTTTYIVLKAKPFKDGLILSLETVTDRNQSEAIEGSEVWIDKALFKSNPNETPYLLEIENFLVVDKALGSIGQITGFSFNGLQDLLVVESTKASKSYFEIPFVDQFVLKIDHEKSTLFVDLPEGLIELNSESSDVQNDGQDEEN